MASTARVVTLNGRPLRLPARIADAVSEHLAVDRAAGASHVAEVDALWSLLLTADELLSDSRTTLGDPAHRMAWGREKKAFRDTVETLRQALEPMRK